ncbi:hypothetical protein ACFWPH_28075 [Nocardia sp. NPDC058499]|uniref:terpene synthase family protein n=1 Tax=Nocardia sp. NPDC058499 TaxID=3346530 RepID=UPI00366425F0
MTTTTAHTRIDDRAGAAVELGLRCAPHPQPAIGASGVRVQQWVRDRGLTSSEESFAWYRQWDTAGFVGASYPHASTDGMDLVGRFMAVSILLDDSLEELDSAAECAQKVAPFVDIVRAGGEVAAPDARPLHQAFGEVIRECRLRASARWWRRAAHHWEASLASVVHEVGDRVLRGRPAPRDIHLSMRRHGGYMHPFLDIIEPAAGFELPELAFHAPQIAVMRECIVQIGNLVNDLYSLPKEVARGQHTNLVLVLNAESGGILARSRQTVVDLVTAHARRFRTLRAELPAMCDYLGLSGADRGRVLRYAEALELWAGGYEPWHRTSARYRHVLTTRPPTGPWAYEELIDTTTVRAPQ